MKVLVMIGPDALGLTSEAKHQIGTETEEHVFENQEAPDSSDGWIFLDCGKVPTYSKYDAIFVYGTCDQGRHTVTETFGPNVDIKTALVQAYTSLSEEQDSGETES